MAYQYWGDGGVTTAVIDCITREGIHGTSIETVARELRRSRSALYQRYRSWRGLLTSVHEDLLKMYNGAIDYWCEDRPAVFDRWWKTMGHELRVPRGVAFRAMRGLVAEQRCELLALEEVAQMPSLIRWVDEGRNGEAAMVALHLWLFRLGSVAFESDSFGEEEFRQLAWAQVAQHDACRTTVQPSG